MASRKPPATPLATGEAPGLTAILRWPSIGARRWIERALPQLRSDSNTAALVAIGSAVREVAISADLDLVLIYDGRKPILETPPVDVDLREYRLVDVERLIDRGEELLGCAVQFGRVVYERAEVWSSIVRRMRGRVPNPSSTAALERARRARAVFQDLLAVGDEDAAREQLVTMLTHLARARLLQAGVYPKSRPELPAQLRQAGETKLANEVEDALQERRPLSVLFSEATVVF